MRGCCNGMLGHALLLLVMTASTRSFHAETRYPCAFIDTINITGRYDVTGNMSDAAGEWVTIRPELVAVYDFVIENGLRVPADQHLRACVCKLKPCVRFCCESGQLYDLDRLSCRTPNDVLIGAPPDQKSIEIVLPDGTLTTVDTAAHFNVQIKTPCDRMRAVTKSDQLVHWSLHANGTVTHAQHIFAKHYCFSPMRLHDVWDWQPLVCAPEKLHFILGVREWTYAICLMISVICMILVVCVYLLCTEMRNTFYGVAIKAYAICVAIGYSLLAHLTLKDPAQMSKTACIQIPSFTLLCLVLSFYILCFIAFNLYLNFHGVILTKLMFWLIFCPIVLVAVGWCFFVAFVYHETRPVFGGDTCWFDPRNWSIMVYFYTPIFVACAICGFFYILTLIRISERSEFDAAKSCAPLEENRFKSFWMFFGYTFLSWAVCVFSFAFNYYSGERTHLNYAVCCFVTFHGFGALHALICKNRQIQIFLQRIDENIDEDICENSMGMASY